MTSKYVTLKELHSNRPINEKRVEKKAKKYIAVSRATRLADLRQALELTQMQLAANIGVNQSNISRIENGKFDQTEIKTLQAYIEALGGTLEIRAKFGNQSQILIDSEYEKNLTKN